MLCFQELDFVHSLPSTEILSTTNQFLFWFTVENQQAVEWEASPSPAMLSTLMNPFPCLYWQSHTFLITELK